MLGGRQAKVEKTLRSVVSQSWGHWQVTAVGGDSVEAAVVAVGDSRIRYRRAADGATWSEARASLEHEPSRDFVLFLQAGDLLAPDCFFEVASSAARDPRVDLVYWDDDVIDPVRGGKDPQFRPAWSPDFLLSTDYIGSAFAVRHRRLAACGGVSTQSGDGGHWDLLLRCGLASDQVRRVPRLLSHVGGRLSSRPELALAAVSNHLDREGGGATARWERGAVRVVWPPDLTPKVSIVIPTRHNRPLIGRCLASLRTTDYPEFDVIVVDNGERTPRTRSGTPRPLRTSICESSGGTRRSTTRP